MHFLLVLIVLDVLVSVAAARLFKAGRLPPKVCDLLCLHKLCTPVVAGLVAPFAAFAFSAFWLALAVAVVLSWSYLIFAVATGCALVEKGSDGAVVYLATCLWGSIAPLATAVPAALIHLLIVMLR